MRQGLACIMAGLGTRHSDGIGVKLKNELEQIAGMTVVSGSHSEGTEFAELIRATPVSHDVFIIGHSLGGSHAPQVARWAGRPIAAIFGFDPAENWAADNSRYGLTTIPPNVHVARAAIASITGLGGGRYEAEDKDRTFVENITVPGTNHLNVDDVLAQRLLIGAFVRRAVSA